MKKKMTIEELEKAYADVQIAQEVLEKRQQNQRWHSPLLDEGIKRGLRRLKYIKKVNGEDQVTKKGLNVFPDITKMTVNDLIRATANLYSDSGSWYKSDSEAYYKELGEMNRPYEETDRAIRSLAAEARSLELTIERRKSQRVNASDGPFSARVVEIIQETLKEVSGK